jgi:hypothetical protein
MIHNFLHGTYYIVLALSEKMRIAIQNRARVIEELKMKESMNLEQLRGFKENVGGTMRRLGRVFPGKYVTRLCSEVERVFQLHDQMYRLLQTFSIDFMVELGTQFRAYSNALILYQGYFGCYRDFESYNANPALSSQPYLGILQEFCATPYAKGVQMNGIMNAIFRGPFSLALLFREVLKYTPPQHPDYVPLKECYTAMESSVHTVESTNAQEQRNADLGRLRSELARNPDMDQIQRDMMSGRTFLGKFRVKQRGHFYYLLLFNDELWVAKILENKTIVVEQRYPLPKLTVTLVGVASLACVIEAQITRQVRCANTQGRDDLYSEVRAAGQEIDSGVTLKWEQVLQGTEQKHLALEGHAMFVTGDFLWIYGGCYGNDNARGDIHTVSLVTKKLQIRPFNAATDPPVRMQFAYALRGTTEFYIFGGCSEGKQQWSDFWCLDLPADLQWDRINLQWRRLKGPGPALPPLVGASLAVFEDCLLLVGGKGTDGFPIWRYFWEGKRWVEVRATVRHRRDICNHSLFPVAPGVCLLFGSQQNTTPLLLTDYGQTVVMLKTSGFGPVTSGFRCAVKYGNMILVFNDDNDDMVFAIDLKRTTDMKDYRWTVLKPLGRLEGVRMLSNYAICAGENCIWLHGGVTKYGHTESALYRVQLHSAPGTVLKATFGGLPDKFLSDELDTRPSCIEESWD